MKRVSVFLLLWLGWGFTLGTALLLGPLRTIVNFERKRNFSSSVENTTVVGLIILLIIVSLFVAWLSLKKYYAPGTSAFTKRALFFVPIAGLCCCVYAFLNPQIITGINGSDEKVNNSFTVGSYPELEQLEQLKDQGYEGVISLLHPAVVPFEPALIEKEKKNAEEVGLKFISIPMLPWISENESSIDSLKKLVAKPHGKYYLHCYLGRDRIKAAAKIIKQVDEMGVEGLTPHSELNNIKLERGTIGQLDKDVYIAPFPTKEEYFRIIPNFENAVSLADLNNKEALELNKQEQQWLKPYNVRLTTFSVNETTTEEQMKKVVAEVKKLSKPLLIHGFFTDSKEVNLFKKIYNDASN